MGLRVRPASAAQPSLGTWHYNGRTWAQVTAAAGAIAGIYRASAVSRAQHLGDHGQPAGRLGRALQRRRLDQRARADAALANTQLSDVLAVSRHNVWVSGTTPANAADGQLVLAHWNGRCWQRFTAPWPVQQAERFATDGARRSLDPGRDRGHRPRHLDPASVARRRLDPNQITAARGSGVGVGDLALIPGTTTLWGTGGMVTTSGGDAAIWDHGVIVDRLAVQIHHWPPRDTPPAIASTRGVIRFYLTLGNNAAVRVFLNSGADYRASAGQGRPAARAAR